MNRIAEEDLLRAAFVSLPYSGFEIAIQADVNGKHYFPNGDTILHTASGSDMLKHVRCLIKQGHADANATNYEGQTALHLASAGCSLKTV